jgi:curli biogenesis system outer membrane secretion channel CsgG
MRRKVLSLLFVIFMSFLMTGISPLYAQRSKKMRMAVLELTPLKVRPELATGVTDLLITELVNCGEFDVLERTQVAQILNEQGFQQTGVTDASAAVEAGRMLNTDMVMIGTLQQFDQSLVINVRIVEVSTAKILFADREVADNNDKLIDASSLLIDSITARVTGKAVTRKTPQRAQPKAEKVPDDQLPVRVFHANKSKKNQEQGSGRNEKDGKNDQETPESGTRKRARDGFEELDRDAK